MSKSYSSPETARSRLAVSPPGNLQGALTVIDERTGKKYRIPVSQDGTVKSSDFKKISTGMNDKGLKLYDPGYLNTAPVRSSISYIDGDEGVLRYRGYPIEELAESSSFVEVAYLVVYGSLPSQSQLADWEFAILQHSALPQGVLDIIQAMPHDAHPMGVLVSAMSTLSIYHPDANPALRGQDLYKSKQVRDKQIARIIGKAPTIAAAAYLRLAGRPPVIPSSNLSYSENFLYMLDSLGDRSYKPNPRLARVLDILFILHAEHEMNCSTSAARHLASSGVDVYTALAGAVGALYGPLHGGANEAVLKMLSEIGTVENIPGFLEGVKNRKRKMSGFGHRVYKNYDPRAKVIKKLAEEVFSIVGRDPLIEVAVALEKAALADEYFVKRKLYPNVDFYSGLIYRAMGFPTEFFPVLFAIPRMAGYLAHWRESLDDPDTKIMRPQQWLPCYGESCDSNWVIWVHVTSR
ncbi:CITRATE SYNTHASE [Salix purpurea]|uniref:Citrate synthase n=1 Tax=Salix purpurea TaxID=77065 RepID=A0A9Q0SK28_SALPP|nr:CITRATE SYNTHASE [Salix purpurea]